MIITHNGNIIMSDGFILNKVSSTPTPPSFADTKSFQFDGITDYFVGVGTYSELNAQNKMTLSLWMKPISGAPLYEYVITVPRNSTANEHVFSFQHFENNYLSFSIDGRTTKYALGNISAITYGQWNHVMCCLDGTLSGADRMRVYVNGVDETYQTAIGTFTALQNASGGLMIAEEPQGAYNPYKGLIDEVAIWSGSDQRANVSEIWNGGLPNDLNNLPTAPQPTTLFRMGENAVWDGSKFVMTDVNGGYVNTSVGILPTDPNPTTDVPLFDNKSFTYDGVSDYVDIGTLLNFLGNKSVSIWLKFTDSGSYRVALNVGSDAYGMYSTAGKIAFYHKNTSNTYKDIIATTTTNDGQWHHYLGVNDGTNLKLFIDGVLDNSNTNGSNGTTANANGRIGARWNNLNIFSGSINDVSIFDTDQSANALTIFNGGVPNDISALSPLGYWRAEQVTFDGTNWTLIDQGSGGNNGLSSSMPLTSRTSDVPLFDNKSFTYDGIDDSVNVGLLSDLNGTQYFSMSMWVNPSALTSSTDHMIFSTYTTSTNKLFFEFFGNQFGVNITNGTSRVVLFPMTFLTGQWYHITLVYDGTQVGADKLKCYFDGVSQTNTQANFPSSLGTFINDCRIGSYDPYFAYYSFNGNIDEFAFFNTALSQANVTEIYNGGIANDISNLNPISYWRSEFANWDGSNWTLIDQGSGANNGTSVSMPLTSRTSDVPT